MCAVIWIIPVDAQEVSVADIYRGTRLVNGHSTRFAERGILNMDIQHRFGDIRGGAYELFGLDQATMRMGFEYGVTNFLSVGIGRSSYMKAYDAFVKTGLFRQGEGFPVTVAITAGGSLPTLRDYFPPGDDSFGRKFSPFAQMHLAYATGRFGLLLSPGFANSGYLLQRGDNVTSATMGIGGTVRISKRMSVNAEYIHRFNDELPGSNPLSFGFDLDTRGHLFQLIFSNTRMMFEQGQYTATAGDWAKGHIYFGFNLIREFTLKYYEP